MTGFSTKSRRLSLWVVLACAASLAAQASETGPIVRRDGAHFTLVLPETMRDSLSVALPGFVPWTLENYTSDIRRYYTITSRQAPWAVVGDFDGDGRSDAIVAGHTDSLCVTVCLWGGSAHPAAQVLDRRDCVPGHDSLARVLMYAAPGLQGTNFSDETVFTFTDAFVDYIFEKAGETWYWKDGKFHRFLSSD